MISEKQQKALRKKWSDQTKREKILIQLAEGVPLADLRECLLVKKSDMKHPTLVTRRHLFETTRIYCCPCCDEAVIKSSMRFCPNCGEELKFGKGVGART